MKAADLILEVQTRGGSIWVEGEHLEVEVPCSFPNVLIEEIRDHKPEILAMLTEQTETILDRLRTGQVWLTSQHQRWQAGDTTAANDAEFSRVWDGWWKLDIRLRSGHRFQGCIHGADGACPDGLPCQFCADVPASSPQPQHR